MLDRSSFNLSSIPLLSPATSLSHILLPPSRKVGDKIRVQIFYSTTKDCTAVQWLDKESVGCSAWGLFDADAIGT